MGNQLEVAIGTHGQLTTYSAIRVAHYLEPYHPFWFEEPLVFEKGYIVPPAGPGLGVEFDEKVLKAHLVE